MPYSNLYVNISLAICPLVVILICNDLLNIELFNRDTTDNVYKGDKHNDLHITIIYL